MLVSDLLFKHCICANLLKTVPSVLENFFLGYSITSQQQIKFFFSGIIASKFSMGYRVVPCS